GDRSVKGQYRVRYLDGLHDLHLLTAGGRYSVGADVSVSADGIRNASYRLAVCADLVADLAIPAPCLPDDGGTALEGGGVGEHLPHLLYCKWALPIDGLPGKRVIWSAHTNPFFVVVKLLLYC